MGPRAAAGAQDLILGGLYKALALALFPGPFWPVSVVSVEFHIGELCRRFIRTGPLLGYDVQHSLDEMGQRSGHGAM